MRRGTTIVAVLGAFALLASAAAPTQARPHDGEVVRDWTELAFAAVRANNASDARAARLYAMVTAAMYDAVNGTAGGPAREAAIVPEPARPATGDARVAAASAAHDVLGAVYPAQSDAYDQQLAYDVASVPPARSQPAREWGAEVARRVLAGRSDDGSAPESSRSSLGGIGVFTGTFNGIQFRFLKPFAIEDSGAYMGSGPPPLSSSEYAAAFAEVKAVGDGRVPDPAAQATFDFWAIGSRSNQPPGAWLQVAAVVSEGRRLPLDDTARLFALQGMALADTVAPTYATKYVFDHWRPQPAIRQAADDQNQLTAADAGWTARGGSSGTPEYWSGHSAFSAAGAAILAGFFCEDAISFALTTDPPAGKSAQTRTYGSFSEAAAEAGRSRVLGGLHFEFSNQAGLAAGRAVADEVLAGALLREAGPTHRGGCPR